MIHVSQERKYTISLDEKVVKELFQAVKEENETGRPAGAILLRSLKSKHQFEIIMGESSNEDGFTIVERLSKDLPETHHGFAPDNNE